MTNEKEQIFITVPVLLSEKEFEELFAEAKTSTRSNLTWAIRKALGFQATPRNYKKSENNRVIVSHNKYLTMKKREN